MSDEAEDVVTALHELARRARRKEGAGAHPAPEALTAYHAGELSASAAEELQEHLAVCPLCARLLLDLPGFLEPPAPPAARDEEADADWGELRKHLPVPSTSAALRPRVAAVSRLSPPRLARLLAAALLAVAIGTPLGWILARRAAAPELPPESMALEAGEVQRGNPEPAAPAIVHTAAAASVLVLHLAREQSNLRFRVELWGAGAPAAPSVTPPHALQAIDSHTLLLILARRQLAAGRYSIRVVDPEQRSREPLGEFAILVVEP
jgi:hypothetical protein